MADYQPTPAESGVYPFEDRIMDPERQLPERTSRPLNLAVVGPAAVFGMGLIGAASYLLARRRSETLAEKVARMIEERRVAAVDLADSVYSDVSHFASHEGRDMAEDAAKKGRTFFKLGKKKAAQAYEDVADEVPRKARQVAKASGKVAKSAKRSADRLYERYPLLTGLLLAALIQQGEKLLEQRQQSQTKTTSKRSTRKATA
jgi:hypothetical protein